MFLGSSNIKTDEEDYLVLSPDASKSLLVCITHMPHYRYLKWLWYYCNVASFRVVRHKTPKTDSFGVFENSTKKCICLIWLIF